MHSNKLNQIIIFQLGRLQITFFPDRLIIPIIYVHLRMCRVKKFILQYVQNMIQGEFYSVPTEFSALKKLKHLWF